EQAKEIIRTMTTYFTLSAISLAIALIPYYIAKKRGAKASFWLIMGLVFGPLAIPFVFYAKTDQQKEQLEREEDQNG
ncbi:MAG: hypothetical protein V3S89_02675, partial [Desulfobacterales bacterium]